MTDKRVLGIDVSKAWLDMAVDGHVERVANDPAAIGAVLDRIGPARIAVVAFEPTGGYERALVAAPRPPAPCRSGASIRTRWPASAPPTVWAPRPMPSTRA